MNVFKLISVLLLSVIPFICLIGIGIMSMFFSKNYGKELLEDNPQKV